ncbi:IclR family transcriptional regulator [Paenibacillus sp. N1-5-1-14]|uniref:IclR family transcriptional regulator n=1 Tax=Paenibacillus radicibacter TaxID=2972488 RepID=UPI002158CC7A|nr:IclR family transcriptional regulator [Paenibacillus radicibacter]MCR8644032.1 IclR family transcriptional regulator [Paenibacillus radicibacter]
MEKKYWVPALEKANDILLLIAQFPSELKMMDLSKQLNIHKSSMFSLLNTMEILGWIVRNADSTYGLGVQMGMLGMCYSNNNSLIHSFHREAAISRELLGETIQLAKLEQQDVLYLAKEEAPTPVKLASHPGMKLPAHATALGKCMLARLDQAKLTQLYPVEEATLKVLTPYTLSTTRQLKQELTEIRVNGYALDQQESVEGFQCVAAPIVQANGQVVAAVSCSMPKHVWEHKEQAVIREIVSLAERLSGSTHII